MRVLQYSVLASKKLTFDTSLDLYIPRKNTDIAYDFNIVQMYNVSVCEEKVLLNFVIPTTEEQPKNTHR